LVRLGTITLKVMFWKGSPMSQKQDISSSSAKIYDTLPVFVLCEKCYWCATFLNKNMIRRYNPCPECTTLSEFSSFPILANESFTFDYNDKRGVELEFKNRN
jgi:hypothetical protein